MIEISQFDSPMGKISVAERRRKVLTVCFGGSTMMRRSRPELWALDDVAESKMGPNAAALLDYLSGKTDRLHVAVDTSLVTGAFDRNVLRRLVRLRHGQTVSYGELAKMVGSPRGARAVGGAMRRNPIPIVIPCHRVVPRAGGLGNYTGGVNKKRWLLEREGCNVG